MIYNFAIAITRIRFAICKVQSNNSNPDRWQRANCCCYSFVDISYLVITSNRWMNYSSSLLQIGGNKNWVWVQLQSLKLQISHLLQARSSLTFRQTKECGFTLECVHDMTRTYSQMHHTDKCSQHSSIIWPVRLNGWVFAYELSGCGFKSSCSHLNIQ